MDLDVFSVYHYQQVLCCLQVTFSSTVTHTGAICESIRDLGFTADLKGLRSASAGRHVARLQVLTLFATHRYSSHLCNTYLASLILCFASLIPQGDLLWPHSLHARSAHPCFPASYAISRRSSWDVDCIHLMASQGA